MVLRVRRIHEGRSAEDGFRVLVDGLWPRGFSKQNAGVDLWLKEIAPSPALRRWFAHDPAKWSGFVARYHRELKHNPEPVMLLLSLARKGPVTLLFGSRDQERNNAVALAGYCASSRP